MALQYLYYRVVESNQYKAFGVKDYTNKEHPKATGYIGKKKDTESNLGDHGVRKYDADLGRFLCPDAMWEKYISYSPYQYAGNDPVNKIDWNGKDIIVLIDREGASGAGHAAMLIGNDNKGWELISKNGGTLGIIGGSKKPQLGNSTDINAKANYNSLDAFIYDKHSKQSRYEEGFRIKTDDEQDTKMSEIGKKEAKSNYYLLGSNCMDVVQNAMLGVGLNPWKVFKGFNGKKIHEGGQLMPNDEYEQIKEINKGEVIDLDELRKSEEK